jgi:hypothetical protein
MFPVGAPEQGVPTAMIAAIDAHDVTIFFARIGDQDRFAARDPAKVCVMSYARTAPALASVYGRMDHRPCVALKDAVNAILQDATEIEITCPLGTRLRGRPPAHAKIGVGEVSIRRFPMGVPQPVEMTDFKGEVILANYLTPTGSQYYEPASLALPEPVTAQVDGNIIQNFTGDPAAVASVRAHYATVAKTLGIEPYYVHSWHAGLHPGCHYDAPASADPDRWSNTVFTSPRFLHFHTCGKYPPGEICWMVENPTVMVDGQALWSDGALSVGVLAGHSDVLAEWPALAGEFVEPVTLAGLGLGCR